jgi:hypothetical protein
MKKEYPFNSKQLLIITIISTIIALSLTVSPAAFGHGGKQHKENEFTALSALQKATKLYSQLIAKGKLSENWEINLSNIEISTLNSNNTIEYMVSFAKSNGEPKEVFIFFDSNGNYNGSNFTGKS